MSAEVLRAAASLMRERAEAASPSEVWSIDDATVRIAYRPHVTAVAYAGTADNAEHIASWHPAVALAVADWLEESASDLDGRQRSVDGLLSGIGAEGTVQIDAEHLAPAALAVARLYLGSDS